MKTLTLLLGLLFLLGSTYIQANELEEGFTITEGNEINYWVIEK